MEELRAKQFLRDGQKVLRAKDVCDVDYGLRLWPAIATGINARFRLDGLRVLPRGPPAIELVPNWRSVQPQQIDVLLCLG